MMKRRWMKSVLAESKKDQIEMLWARQVRAKRQLVVEGTLKQAS